MKTERVKELITGLISLEWNENLDSIYHYLIEIDYLLSKYRGRNEYIDKIRHNITSFCWESDYSNKEYIFNLIKASCNVFIKYIL